MTKTPNKEAKRLATVEDFRKAAASGEAVRGFLMREASIGKIDIEKRTVELAFSSETPVDRGWLIEILDHGKDSVDMGWIASGRAPLCADHNLTVQIGVIDSAELGKDRVGRAIARFGKSEQADVYFQDVVDGIRTCISVGYSIDHVILEEETETGAIYRVMKWKPLEISLVSLPADQTVGIGRSEGEEGESNTPISNIKPTEKRTMPEANNTGAANANAPAAPQVDANQIRADLIRDNQTRTNEIMALAKRHNMVEKGVEFIASGKSVEEFRSFVLENIGAAAPVTTGADNNGNIGLTDKQARGFSFARLLNFYATPDSKAAREAAAFELDVCAAVAANHRGRQFRGNIQIPTEVLAAAMSKGQRALNVTTGSAGGYTVDTDLQAGSFIEVLRNKLLVKQLGAKVLSGLEGDVAIPKQTGGATAYWIVEGSDTTPSQQTFGQVALRPKTVSAQTRLTRKLLLQSSLDIENLVRDDLAFRLAAAIDKAALKGSGVGAEPLGILNTTGIGSVSITTHTFTHAKTVDLESEVATDNADMGNLAYLASAADRGRMKQTEKASSTGIFLWDVMPGQPGVGMVNGYPAWATNQLADDELIFGNWGDLIIGEWGVLDLLVNPFSDDTNGGVRITAFQDVDVTVRHAESFARTQA